MGWVGDDDVLCTCTHVTCYATAGVVGWGGLGMMTFFALAHMWHATQLLGWWGGVGWVGDDDVVSMGVAPQPCENWREDATRVSRQTGLSCTWQA